MPSNGQRFRIGMIREGALRMTCVEAHCAQEREGWVTILDAADETHQGMAKLIREESGRRYHEVRSEDALEFVDAHGARIGMVNLEPLKAVLERTPPGFLVFIFPPGQACFRSHLDREVIFVHEQGAMKRVHTRPQDFNEDFNETADRVNTLLQRG